MSTADFLLDSLMDDATAVSFVMVAGAERSPSTPSPSVAARMMGVSEMSSGGQGTPSRGKSYSVVSVAGSDRSVCFGIVGNGGSFCIRKNCVIRSHADAKIWFQGNVETCFFIRRGGEGNSILYSQPSIDERRVPVEVRKSWKDQEMTLVEWKLAFRAVENSDDAVNEFYCIWIILDYG
jgi:hypothetical protein